MNTEWHLAHPMPKGATTEKRIAWHLEHVKHCHCREIPEHFLEEMKKLHIPFPEKELEGKLYEKD
jgi:hypothetical protein